MGGGISVRSRYGSGAYGRRLAYTREWHKRNRKRSLERRREWGINHSEVIRQQSRLQVFRDRDWIAQRVARRRRMDPTRHREESRKQRELYPERIRAYKAVCRAVRDGRLVKMPCVVCGNSRSFAHHDDYDRVFDVVWLCGIHHKEIHHSHYGLGCA